MKFSRAFAAAAVLIAVPLQADAQFGGMPGLPGAAGPGFAPPPPPSVCQQLLALRDEAQKHANAIQAEAAKEGTSFVQQLVKTKKLSAREVSQFAAQTFGYPLLDLAHRNIRCDAEFDR